MAFREWVDIKADLGLLPFFPDRVGSHWSRYAQVDVVGINWRTKEIRAKLKTFDIFYFDDVIGR